MKKTKQKSITLSKLEFQSLCRFLQLLVSDSINLVQGNVYKLVVFQVLGSLYEKKIYPKTIFSQESYKVKLSNSQVSSLQIVTMEGLHSLLDIADQYAIQNICNRLRPKVIVRTPSCLEAPPVFDIYQEEQ